MAKTKFKSSYGTPPSTKGYLLKKDLILYVGDNRSTSTKPIDIDPFHILGQRGLQPHYKEKDTKFIQFFTFDPDVAKGYANSCRTDSKGWIHMFKVKRNICIRYLDYIKDPELIDTEEASSWWCKTVNNIKYHGVIIDYGSDFIKNEVAICNPDKLL